ncbi:taste receptor type 2 member 4-like [Dendropsophus ebraccatus]|uniref:taste receptor type 2 member 4-like n=1 Tax=Dendropsophus ebraccatus TaxID=150705 RepID=UPI00383121D4
MFSAREESWIGITTGFTGICLNSMIVVVNLKEWHDGVHVSSCDLVLSFIGLINVCFQANLVLDTIFTAFQTYTKFAREIHLRILSILVFLASCNHWFTVWLCTYYCLRIVNFTSGFLFLLKMRISTYLPKLLVISVIESFLVAVPSTWNMYLEPPHELVLNTSSSHQVISVTISYMLTLVCGTIFPLILTLVATGFTLNSLRRHIVMLKANMVGSSNARTHAHVMAARTMVLLLTLHMIFYMSSLSIVLHSFNVEDFSQKLSWFVIFSFSTFQALIIINGNSKLRRSGKCIMKRLEDWMFHGHLLDPNIKTNPESLSDHQGAAVRKRQSRYR